VVHIYVQALEAHDFADRLAKLEVNDQSNHVSNGS
jgi:hypothetical protein